MGQEMNHSTERNLRRMLAEAQTDADQVRQVVARGRVVVMALLNEHARRAHPDPEPRLRPDECEACAEALDFLFPNGR